MWRSLIAVIGLLAVSGEARADVTVAAFEAPEIPRARPMREQMYDALDDFGVALEEHLGILTNDVLQLQFDGRRKRGRFRVRGASSWFAVGIDSDVAWQHGGAHVNSRVELRLGDHDLEIEIPEFEVRPTSVGGERGVEVRIPLFSVTF